MQLTASKMQVTENALHCSFLSAKIKSTKKGVMKMAILDVKGLTKRYGDFTAIDSISFKAEQGELLGFLGVNGAGKSTTINMLSTLLAPDGGTAEVCGFSLGRNDNDIRRKIGIVYQQNCLDNILTVQENLLCRGIIHGAEKTDAKKRLSELCEILSLGDILKKRFQTLSGGQKRRCEIAAALMHTPELLFLDEPTTGLDPATRKDVWQAVEDLRKNTGMTVFLTTHYMEEAAAANRIIIIDKGQIMAEGTPFELKEKYASDTVKIYCSDDSAAEIRRKLSEQGITSVTEEYGLAFAVKNTCNALSPLYSVRDMIDGFEVIQGSMDNVFLNVCGRERE